MKTQKKLSDCWQPDLNLYVQASCCPAAKYRTEQRALCRHISRLFLAGILLLSLADCQIPSIQQLSAQQQRALDLVDQGTQDLRDLRIDQARGSFMAALELHPLAAAWDGLGCVAFLLQDYTNAERMFIKAYEQDANYLNSIGNLAQLYDLLGEEDLAYKMYQLILTKQPENFRARNNFAAWLYEYGKGGAARLELFKALALAKHPTVLANLDKLEAYE